MVKKDQEQFIFEDLKVYQASLDFVDFVYSCIAAFPRSEDFALKDQFRRAVLSIPLNIAEGSGGSKAEFIRYLKIALRSVRECIAIAEIAHRQNYLSDGQRSRIRQECAMLSRMLTNLHKAINDKGVWKS